MLSHRPEPDREGRLRAWRDLFGLEMGSAWATDPVKLVQLLTRAFRTNARPDQMPLLGRLSPATDFAEAYRMSRVDSNALLRASPGRFLALRADAWIRLRDLQGEVSEVPVLGTGAPERLQEGAQRILAAGAPLDALAILGANRDVLGSVAASIPQRLPAEVFADLPLALVNRIQPALEVRLGGRVVRAPPQVVRAAIRREVDRWRSRTWEHGITEVHAATMAARGSHADLTERLEVAQSALAAHRDPAVRARALGELVAAVAESGEVAKALALAETIGTGLVGFRERAHAFVTLARGRVASGQWREVRETLDRALEAVIELDIPQWRGVLLAAIARVYAEAGFTDAAMDVLAAIEDSRVGLRERIGVLGEMASWLAAEGQNERARDVLQAVHAALPKIVDPEWRRRIARQIVVAHVRLRQWSDALEFVDSQEETAVYTGALAALYVAAREWGDPSVEETAAARTAAYVNGGGRGLASVSFHLELVERLHAAGYSEEAGQQWEHLRTLVATLRAPVWSSVIHERMVNLLVASGRYDEAAAYLGEVQSLYLSGSDPRAELALSLAREGRFLDARSFSGRIVERYLRARVNRQVEALRPRVEPPALDGEGSPATTGLLGVGVLEDETGAD
jgi:hypothetical protein